MRLKLKLILAVAIAVSLLFLVNGFNGMFAGITGRTAEVTKNCTTTLEPFAIKIPYDYEFKHDIIDHEFFSDKNAQLGFHYNGSLTIENTDDKDGYFTVKYDFETPTGKISRRSTKLVSADSREAFEFTYPSKEGEKVTGSFLVEPAIEKRYKQGTVYKNVEVCS